MLEIGYSHPFEIRKYLYLCEKFTGTKVLYLSDLHYNRFSRWQAEKICEEVDKIKPDIILLGGDYADSKRGLYYFKQLMEFISPFKNLFAIPGNHDRWRIKQVREIVENNHGVWLDGRSATIQSGVVTIQIDGGRPATRSNGADLSILFLHRPIDVTKIAFNYNLIFAGHLHGGQAVLWSTENGLYPGRFIYKWNRLSAHFGNCEYLISKGLGDSLPIRYNCRKDAILVEIAGPAPHYK